MMLLRAVQGRAIDLVEYEEEWSENSYVLI